MNPQGAVYTSVVNPNPDDKKSFRVDMEGRVRQRWEKMLADRKISQVDALDALFRWIVDQDDVVQAIVLGQLPPQSDLLELMFDRTRKKHGLRFGLVPRGGATTTATESSGSESNPRSSQEPSDAAQEQRDAAGAAEEPSPPSKRKSRG